MTNQTAVTTFEAVVSPVEITVCDKVQERVAYHELAGNESITPAYEQHKDFFRSLAQIYRAMTDMQVLVKVTVDE